MATNAARVYLDFIHGTPKNSVVHHVERPIYEERWQRRYEVSEGRESPGHGKDKKK